MSDKAVKERPILFSGPLVRALLAGRKTQTRRPAVRRPIDFVGGQGDREDPSCWGYWVDDMYGRWAVLARGLDERHQNGLVSLPCPYGVPGDRLWVRETFQFETNDGFGDDYEPPFADGRPVQWEDRGDEGRVWCQPHYRATDPEPELCCNDERCSNEDPHGHWQPSIHMPRWASRLTLEITDVRVQRLQDISEDDAKAEGVTPLEHIGADQPILDEPRRGRTHGSHPHVLAFACKWDDIYSETAAWVANPWVWALTFRVVR